MTDVMKDARVEIFKVGMTYHGRGMHIKVFRETLRYQYSSGVGGALQSIWRVVYPIMVSGAASFIKYGGKTFLQQGNISEALKAEIKPALYTMIKTAGEKITRRVETSSVTATLPERKILYQNENKVGYSPFIMQS